MRWWIVTTSGLFAEIELYHRLRVTGYANLAEALDRWEELLVTYHSMTVIADLSKNNEDVTIREISEQTAMEILRERKREEREEYYWEYVS